MTSFLCAGDSRDCGFELHIFSNLHSIRARYIVACSIFEDKGERGFDITDLTFFGFFSSSFWKCDSRNSEKITIEVIFK